MLIIASILLLLLLLLLYVVTMGSIDWFLCKRLYETSYFVACSFMIFAGIVSLLINFYQGARLVSDKSLTHIVHAIEDVGRKYIPDSWEIALYERCEMVNLKPEQIEFAATLKDKLLARTERGFRCRTPRVENHKEVTDKTLDSKVKSMVTNEAWEKDVKRKDISPNYKFYFQLADGGDAKPVLYEVWFTDGIAEIFFGDNPSYKRLSKDESEKLIVIIQ